MKRFILMVVSFAAVLVTVPVFAHADFRPGVVPEKEMKLEQGLRVRFQGDVRRIDMREGTLWLRDADGVVTLKAPREQLAKLAPGDKIRVAVERGPRGVDHVVRMWRVIVFGGTFRYDEM